MSEDIVFEHQDGVDDLVRNQARLQKEMFRPHSSVLRPKRESGSEPNRVVLEKRDDHYAVRIGGVDITDDLSARVVGLSVTVRHGQLFTGNFFEGQDEVSVFNGYPCCYSPVDRKIHVVADSSSRRFRPFSELRFAGLFLFHEAGHAIGFDQNPEKKGEDFVGGCVIRALGRFKADLVMGKDSDVAGGLPKALAVPLVSAVEGSLRDYQEFGRDGFELGSAILGEEIDLVGAVASKAERGVIDSLSSDFFYSPGTLTSKLVQSSGKASMKLEADLVKDFFAGERQAWASGLRLMREVEQRHGVKIWSGSARELREIMDWSIWSHLAAEFGPLASRSHADIRRDSLDPEPLLKEKERLSSRRVQRPGLLFLSLLKKKKNV